jgi:hypothetical protein
MILPSISGAWTAPTADPLKMRVGFPHRFALRIVTLGIMELRDRLIQAYIDHVLEEGKPPASVYKFCKALAVAEKDFYGIFSSFPALEGQIWASWVEQTCATISASGEWPGFNARQRFLTFLFAFFERAVDHRSFLLARFPCPKTRLLREAPSIAPLKRRFTRFAETVLEHGIGTGEIPARAGLERLYAPAFTEVFLAAIDFHVNDDSPGFERTDACIEKTVVLAFDLVGRSLAESAFDLIRFVLQPASERNG